MFFLETKDGDRFFTDKNSDDRLEFEKILSAKLGEDAAMLFVSLMHAESVNADVYLSQFSQRFKDCISALDNALADQPIDIDKLEAVLSDFQHLYTDSLL